MESCHHSNSWPSFRSWLASCPGVLYLVTRYGSTGWRRLALEGNYRRGRWHLQAEGTEPELVALISQYSHGGSVLELGCGNGRLAASLPPDSWQEYRGIDLAPSALQLARARELPGAEFVEADMELDLPAGSFDLIICEESLYYVAASRQSDFLNRLERLIKPGGKLLVTVADSKRYAHLIDLLTRQFQLVEKGGFPGVQRVFMVLQPKPSS